MCRKKLFLVTIKMLLLKCWRSSTGDAMPLELCMSALPCCRNRNSGVTCRRIVERASQEEVTVDYANDLDTKRYV